jgi:hypothetical protein
LLNDQFLGKGIVATKDIKKGTLLLVSKPFAAGYAEDFSGYLRCTNLIDNKAKTAEQKLQIIRTIENLRKNPSKAKELYKLYAGDLPRDEDIPDGTLF